MDYYILNYAYVLILPFVMFIISLFGKIFAKSKINSVAGYRTRMSKLNRDTWETANIHFAKMWFKLGLAMLGISAICGISIFFVSRDIAGLISLGITLIQLLIIVLSPFETEKMLINVFDDKGNRK